MKIAPPDISKIAGQTGQSWISIMTDAMNALRQSGTTAKRPTTMLYPGRPYYDTTLAKPIWYKGPGWIDATGAAA